MGFYLHDQKGGGYLPCWRGSITMSSTKGVASVPVARLSSKQQTKDEFNCNAQTHVYVVTWCERYCLWLIQLKWSGLHLKCKFKLHMLFKLAKLQMPKFVHCNPCCHVCDMPLIYKWLYLHFNGWSWNSNWIEIEIIPIKSNSKSYWSHFKFNSNIVESCIFE